MPVAAVDVGTNTVRLLVADVVGGRTVGIERGLEITRLGRGVDAQGRFEPEALDRTVAVVGRFVERARNLGAHPIRVAGTSAVRDAGDRDAFIDAVRGTTGIQPEILTGRQEGRLAFLGATADLSGGVHVVLDIGGGSTELIREDAVCSVDVGSVRVRERFLVSDPPSEDEIDRAVRFLSERLSEVDAQIHLTAEETLVGVAGTVTTLASLVLGLESYDPDRLHGTVLAVADIEDWTDRLAGMRVEEIKGLPTMDPGRADVICAGVLILREVCRRWGYPEIGVSERDILDGLVLDVSGLHGRKEVG